MDGGSSPPISTKQIAGNDAGYLYFVEKSSPPAPPQGGFEVPSWAPVTYGDLLKAGFVFTGSRQTSRSRPCRLCKQRHGLRGTSDDVFWPADLPAIYVSWRKFHPLHPLKGICGALVGTGRLRRLVKSGIYFYWLSPDQPLPPLPSL